MNVGDKTRMHWNHANVARRPSNRTSIRQHLLLYLYACVIEHITPESHESGSAAHKVKCQCCYKAPAATHCNKAIQPTRLHSDLHARMLQTGGIVDVDAHAIESSRVSCVCTMRTCCRMHAVGRINNYIINARSRICPWTYTTSASTHRRRS